MRKTLAILLIALFVFTTFTVLGCAKKEEPPEEAPAVEEVAPVIEEPAPVDTAAAEMEEPTEGE